MDFRIFEVDPGRVRRLWETDQAQLQEELTQAILTLCRPRIEAIALEISDPGKVAATFGALLELGQRGYKILFTPSPFSGIEPVFGLENGLLTLSPVGNVIESYLSKAMEIVEGSIRGWLDPQKYSSAVMAVEPFNPMLKDAFDDDEFLQNFCELIILGYAAEQLLESLKEMGENLDPVIREAIDFRFNASKGAVEFWESLSAAYLVAKSREGLFHKSESGESSRQQLTPQLTRDQHAVILGYDSGRSAARALNQAWREGSPNQGVRRALNPNLLLSPVQKFRETRAMVERWPVPKSAAEILDMYLNPTNWTPKVMPKVKLKP